MNSCDNCCSCNHKYCAKKVSLFTSLSYKDLNKVVNLVAKKSFEKGDTIFSEGEGILFDMQKQKKSWFKRETTL